MVIRVFVGADALMLKHQAISINIIVWRSMVQNMYCEKLSQSYKRYATSPWRQLKLTLCLVALWGTMNTDISMFGGSLRYNEYRYLYVW